LTYESSECFTPLVSLGGCALEPLVLPSTKEQLVLTGERLFAQFGLDGVSLRQIATEAGAGNNSAVRYHFGSKDALAEAILLYRLPRLSWRRKRLTAGVRAGDLRAVLEAHLLPVAEQAEQEDSYYLMFLEQLQRVGTDRHPFHRLSAAYRAEHEAFIARVAGLLDHLQPALASIRVVQAEWVCLHESAERERALRSDREPPDFALFVGDLLDSLVGFLRAPASEATLAALTPRSSLSLTGRTSPP
jgi:AcrR family transcriptional regulator